MLDRVLGIFAYAVLLGFLGILVGFVPRWDLGIVVAVSLALVAYDFLFFEGGKQK
ncbi:MAG: hypothetical protein WDZ84_11605 [Rhodovibrionaceae bacterium]